MSGLQWRPIEELQPKPGESYLLKGGVLDEGHLDCKYTPEHSVFRDRPVVATWIEDDGRFHESNWIITPYDSGVMAVEYEDPTHYAELPQ